MTGKSCRVRVAHRLHRFHAARRQRCLSRQARRRGHRRPLDQRRDPGRGRRFATPVVLKPNGPNRWDGNVPSIDDTFTYYLPVSRRSDRTYAAYLRNPERNDGRVISVSRLELKDSVVRLIGRRGNEADRTQAEGRYDNGRMRIVIQGETYEFTRVTDSSSAFFPRGNPPQRYTYTPPLRLDDGWPIAAVEDVGISRELIERFVQNVIDTPMDSISTSQIHGLLIARHGKLVVEEYFHGHNRYQPHDTRSAAKSWTAVLLGAAMKEGVPIKPMAGRSPFSAPRLHEARSADGERR